MVNPYCRECGASTAREGRGRPKVFCSKTCRMKWHNRRLQRGAELYDFVMSWRFERDQADTLGQITRLASAYRDADKKLRAGRPSWDVEEAQGRLPLGYSINGDNR